jgi:hypothetical protein
MPDFSNKSGILLGYTVLHQHEICCTSQKREELIVISANKKTVLTTNIVIVQKIKLSTRCSLLALMVKFNRKVAREALLQQERKVSSSRHRPTGTVASFTFGLRR